MRTWLLTDKTKRPHQPAHLEATNYLSLIAHPAHAAAATGSTPALAKKLTHPAAQRHPPGINATTLGAFGVVAGSGNIKGCTDHVNGLLLT